MAVVVIIGGCATIVPDEVFFETWSGTWVNTDFYGSYVTPPKFVTHPDGTLNFYSSATSSNSSINLTFIIFDRWTDEDGNNWFKGQKRCDALQMSIYEYGKINATGDTYELIYHIGSVKIEKWEPDNPLYNYVIYYRQ
jgi:hypothetical protein